MSDVIQKTCLCFLISNNKILLLERKNTWYENGKYLPPGGNVDENEKLETATVRELFEETGIVVKESELKLIRNYQSTLQNRNFDSYYFLATNFTGELQNKEPDRHSNVGWFNLNKLPPNTSAVVYDTLKLI